MAKKRTKQSKASRPAAAAAGRSRKYAGFWVRFGAFIVDFIASLVVGMIIPMIGSFVVLAVNIYLIQKEGYSIGKKLFNLRIIKEDGKTPSLVDAIIREVIGKFISAIVLGLGFLLIAIDEKKQGLHDKLAKTYVVKLD
jgi:uncharacterized RDD family membrane protein YckC